MGEWFVHSKEIPCILSIAHSHEAQDSFFFQSVRFSSSHLCFLDVLALRIREIQQLHRLLVPASLLAAEKEESAWGCVHGEHNPSAQDQSGQPRDGPGPECEDAFVLEDLGRTDKAVLIILTGLERLHSIPVISEPVHWLRGFCESYLVFTVSKGCVTYLMIVLSVLGQCGHSNFPEHTR